MEGGQPLALCLPPVLSAIAPPTDADSPLCGIPAAQGISSLSSGTGNRNQVLAPAPPNPWRPVSEYSAFTLQLCPGHGGSWQGCSAPSCALVPPASGCASGASCGSGSLVVILESTSATQARMVRPGTSHPCCLRCSSGPHCAPSPSAPGVALLLGVY